MNSNLKQLPFYSLVLMCVLLPFNWQLSLGVIFIGLSVFLSQPFRVTKEQLSNNRMYILFSGTYFLYVLAMAHTENISFGMRDLEYKFSLFIFPIVLAAMPRISNELFKKVAFVFILANTLAAVIALFVSSYKAGFGYLPTYIELSIFMHPGYFSAYLNLSFIFLVKLFRSDWIKDGKGFLFYVLALFIIGFNIILNSKVGIIVNLLILIVFIIQAGRWLSKKLVATILAALGISFFLLVTQVEEVQNRFQYLSDITNTKNIPKDSNEGTHLRVLIRDQVFEILKEDPWIGVGTGDTKDVLMEYYEKNGIVYAYKNRLNTHNQFFEWLITFGIIGTFLYLISVVYPLFKSIKQGNLYYVYFLIPLLIYFVAESFLEREAGVLFFAFFNAFLFFHGPRREEH